MVSDGTTHEDKKVERPWEEEISEEDVLPVEAAGTHRSPAKSTAGLSAVRQDRVGKRHTKSHAKITAFS